MILIKLEKKNIKRIKKQNIALKFKINFISGQLMFLHAKLNPLKNLKVQKKVKKTILNSNKKKMKIKINLNHLYLKLKN